MRLLLAHLNEVRVVISALPWQDIPVIEAFRIRHQMPLTDDRGLVAGLPEFLRDRVLPGIQPVG